MMADLLKKEMWIVKKYGIAIKTLSIDIAFSSCDIFSVFKMYLFVLNDCKYSFKLFILPPIFYKKCPLGTKSTK